MSTPTSPSSKKPGQPGLFSDEEVPVVRAPEAAPAAATAARVMSPQREQVELRAVDLESLLAPDHAARTVWAFVQALDLAPLYAAIKSVQGAAGAPAIDPQILVALVLLGTT